MFTLASTGTFSQDIRKSHFRASAGPVGDEKGATAFIALHKDQTAGHNCWAWKIGNLYRFSDDGEPGGTAGRPILQAIDGLKLDHVAVLVSRRFGGILLGSGGLMRAYGGTAAACLRACEQVRMVARKAAQISCSFTDMALVEARLTSCPDVIIDSRTYTATGVDLIANLPVEQAQAIATMLADLSSGRTRVAFL